MTACSDMPIASPIAVLRHPNSPIAESATAEFHSAAAAVGKTIEIFDARNSEEIDQAFTQLVQRKAGGLITVPDSVFTTRLIQIITQATRHAIPAVFQSRDWAEAGGLMSYGTNALDVYRQVGVYDGRILKGAKPADLSRHAPTRCSSEEARFLHGCQDGGATCGQ